MNCFKAQASQMLIKDSQRHKESKKASLGK